MKCHDGMGDCENKTDEEDPRLGIGSHPISGQETDHWQWLPPLGHCAPTCTGNASPLRHHFRPTRGETEAQRSRIM